MDNTEYYDSVPDFSDDEPATDTTSMMVIPTINAIAFGGGNNRAARRMEHRLENEAMSEHCKARLTAEVVRNTTALSALGDSCARAVPSAEKPIRSIIHMYAASSAKRIADRW